MRLPRPSSSAFLLLLLLHQSALAQDRVESTFHDARNYTVRIRTQMSTPFIDEEQGTWDGAGFLVDSDRRWVVTNAHVAGQSPSNIQVAFADGLYRPARKLYVDSFTDVAVLELPDDGIRHPAGVCECSREPRVGEGVGVFGHPLNYQFTGTRGIISGKSDKEIVDLLQTDATVVPGNSGGPVIALRDGRIIGIATCGYNLSKTDKVNFATPMPDVCRILDLLRKHVAPDPPQLEFGLLINDQGAQTLEVGSTFNASRWPFQPGDRIVSVGRPAVPVRTPHEFVTAFRGRSAMVPVHVIRKGSEVEVQTHPSYRGAVVAKRGLMIDGALIAPLAYEDSTSIRKEIRLVVQSVESGSAAQSLDFQVSDNVETIDGRTFDGIDDLKAYLAGRKKGTPLRVVLTRYSQRRIRWFDYHVRQLPFDDYKLIGPDSELSARPGEGQ